MRDHIFISYASEQLALCDWLARRLAIEGYAVWCDRQKLLGGENWPKSIDDAIENRTFRMLALISKDSMNKPNPQGEWQKGFAVGQQLDIENFVIPIKTEDLKPEEIIWNFQALQYISFVPSWADGLVLLLKTLRSIETPRSLKNGKQLAIKSMAVENFIKKENEILTSNCFEIIQIPKLIYEYMPISRELPIDWKNIQQTWPCRDVSPVRILSFTAPQRDGHQFALVNEISWADRESIHQINIRNLVVSLIYKSIDCILRQNNMKHSERTRQWYIPDNIIEKNRINVTMPNGTKTWFRAVGRRRYGYGSNSEIYKYYLGPSFSILQNQDNPFVLALKNVIYFTTDNNIPLDKRKILSRRKHLCQAWFNKEWCVRTLGIIQFLADEDGCIRFGPEGKQQLIINATPFIMNCCQSINDAAIYSYPDMVDENSSEDGGGEYI